MSRKFGALFIFAALVWVTGVVVVSQHKAPSVEVSDKQIASLTEQVSAQIDVRLAHHDSMNAVRIDSILGLMVKNDPQVQPTVRDYGTTLTEIIRLSRNNNDLNRSTLQFVLILLCRDPEFPQSKNLRACN